MLYCYNEIRKGGTMKKVFKLLPLILMVSLASCNYLSPVGDGEYNNPKDNDDPIETIYKTTWDFTSLNFEGSLANASPKSNLLTYCNSKQTSNIVSSIMCDGCYVTNISSSGTINKKFIVGNADTNGGIRFNFAANVKNIEIYVESYHEINSEGQIVSINKNSALYVCYSRNKVDLSTEQDKVVEKSQKFKFDVDMDYVDIYTLEDNERIIVNRIDIEYSLNEEK